MASRAEKKRKASEQKVGAEVAAPSAALPPTKKPKPPRKFVSIPKKLVPGWEESNPNMARKADRRYRYDISGTLHELGIDFKTWDDSWKFFQRVSLGQDELLTFLTGFGDLQSEHRGPFVAEVIKTVAKDGLYRHSNVKMSPLSPLCLHCVTLVSPLCLHFVSIVSPLCTVTEGEARARSRIQAQA